MSNINIVMHIPFSFIWGTKNCNASVEEQTWNFYLHLMTSGFDIKVGKTYSHWKSISVENRFEHSNFIKHVLVSQYN